MVGLLAVGFVANLLIRPVSARFHHPESVEAEPTGAAAAVEGAGR